MAETTASEMSTAELQADQDESREFLATLTAALVDEDDFSRIVHRLNTIAHESREAALSEFLTIVEDHREAAGEILHLGLAMHCTSRRAEVARRELAKRSELN